MFSKTKSIASCELRFGEVSELYFLSTVVGPKRSCAATWCSIRGHILMLLVENSDFVDDPNLF